MGPEFSDTPEQDQSPERVSAYGLMVVDDVLEGLDKKKEDMRTILDLIQEKASSVLEFSLKWEEIEEQFGFLKRRALEAEASLRKQTLELEKKEETFLLKQQTEAREIEAKSKVLDLKEKELEEREKEIDLKQRKIEERAIQISEEDREKVSAFVVSDSTSSPVQISEALEGDIEEAVSIDDSDEGKEKEGVPAGSFELDPAALPSSTLNR